MDIDRINSIENQPPLVGDIAEVTEKDSAISVTAESLAPGALPGLRHLREIWTLGLSEEQLKALLKVADPELLHIEGSHTADLDAPQRLGRLRALAISWNNKLASLECLAGLAGLEVLSLSDLKRVRDLSPLAGLKGLRALQLTGGTWSIMAIGSLAPLVQLQALEELRLIAVRIQDGSLAPLGELPRLRALTIPGNAASTEEFARLAARRPDVACAALHPYVRLDGVIMPGGTDPVAALEEIGDDTVLVTGKGKPFLRARSDRERLLRYCARFEAARAG